MREEMGEEWERSYNERGKGKGDKDKKKRKSETCDGKHELFTAFTS
jgi:hypothetical protein